MVNDFEERSRLALQNNEIIDAARRHSIRESSTRTTFRFTPWGLWMLSELSRYVGKSQKHVVDLWVGLMHGLILKKDSAADDFTDEYFDRTYDSSRSKRRTQLVSEKTRDRLKEISEHYKITRDHALEVILLFASDIYRSKYKEDLAELNETEIALSKWCEEVFSDKARKYEKEYLEKVESFEHQTLMYDVELVAEERQNLIDDRRTELSDPLRISEAPECPFAIDPTSPIAFIESADQSNSMDRKTSPQKAGSGAGIGRKDGK